MFLTNPLQSLTPATVFISASKIADCQLEIRCCFCLLVSEIKGAVFHCHLIVMLFALFHLSVPDCMNR